MKNVGGLNLSCENQIRLTGGKPFLQDQNNNVDAACSSENEMVYEGASYRATAKITASDENCWTLVLSLAALLDHCNEPVCSLSAVCRKTPGSVGGFALP